MERIIQIINDWDPIGFFPMAPKDEYINEIKKINEFVCTNYSLQVHTLAQEINKIFVETFGTDVYKEDLEQCTIIAKKILNRMVKFKLTVAHGKCLNCGTERILYFTSNSTYGERIVSTKSGKKCAYANILDENIMQELERKCTELCLENGISISSSKLAGIISSVYGITCDDVDGEKIDTIPNTKCPNCLESKVVEDNKFGEQLKEIEAVEVTHNSWEMLEDNERKEKLKQEMRRQGYLE